MMTPPFSAALGLQQVRELPNSTYVELQMAK